MVVRTRFADITTFCNFFSGFGSDEVSVVALAGVGGGARGRCRGVYTAYGGGGPSYSGLDGIGENVKGGGGSTLPPIARLIIPPTASEAFKLTARACPLNCCARPRAALVAVGEVGVVGVLAPDPEGVIDREREPGWECAM